MSGSRRLSGFTLYALATAVVFLSCARQAAPAELTAYISGGRPTGSWGGGYGGMLTITLFNLVHGDGEVGWQTGDASDTGVLLVAGKVYIGPSLGRLVPYAGLGAGYYAEGKPGDDTSGSFGEVFAGLKIKLPLGLLLRGELQWINLGSNPPISLDGRFFLGAGISF
jgi:hypothetical protein